MEHVDCFYEGVDMHVTTCRRRCEAEYRRLSAAGVEFTQPPTGLGAVTVFDDTCANLIQIITQN